MGRPAAFIGCAGWSLPAASQAAFGPGATHLQRYATRLNACEINSSFHRPHRRETYARWAEAVPAAFRFSVKLPQTITHERKLVGCEDLIDEFMQQAGGLEHRLGCVLVQLPPSLAFDAAVAQDFFAALRRHWFGAVAAEPRHASWFDAPADQLLAAQGVARVLADPVRHAAGAFPGGRPDLVYLRLHGSPRMYYSGYEAPLIAALARRIAQALEEGAAVWCIFDNTAAGAATDNALGLEQAIREKLG
jgi:uncharacterized protein YecE (DUF72 family)